jgi:predicted MFS family arabinose efflux permease
MKIFSRKQTDGASSAERRVVLLVACVQFLHTTDVSMFFPMAPMLAGVFKISTAHVGYLGSAYVLSACVAGIAGALIMDRFDRAKALGVTIGGLAFATALGGLADSVTTLVAARVLAGLFGGPAAGLSLAIVADAVPEGRRGRALATASIGGTLSIIVGVPVLLELMVWGGWRLPFFALAALCAVVFVGVRWSPLSRLGIGIRHYSPTIRATIGEFAAIASRRMTVIALLAMGVTVVSLSMLVGNLGAFLVYNLHYPQDSLAVLWSIMGVITFLGSLVAGRMNDRIGALPTMWCMTALFAISTAMMFVYMQAGPALIAMFGLWVVSNNARFVIISALMSSACPPNERGRFMSLVATVINAAMGGAMAFAASFLGALPSGELTHVHEMAWLSVATALTIPFLTMALLGSIGRSTAVYQSA